VFIGFFPGLHNIDKHLIKLMNKSRRSNKQNQVGGAGSDFSGLWYSWEVSPAELSRVTLEKIDCSPMFNPLRKGTVIPTGTSGIIPAGVYLAALPPLVDSCATVECYNRGQVGLVTPAEQVAVAEVAAQQRLRDQQFVRQLAAQEGFPQQTGLVSDNGIINSLAQFMGMNPNGPSQTGSGSGSGSGSTSRKQTGGNVKSIKYVPNNKMSSNGLKGGCCGSEGFYTGSNNFQNTTSIGPNQVQQGGTLSNGLGYSPFKGSQMTATSCGNSCVPFNNTCTPFPNINTSNTLSMGLTPPGYPSSRGRQPVYYSETESREGCTTRCKMPPGRYARSDLGCRATAFSNRDIDYGTYDDLHGTNIAANAAPLPQACVRR
jgi:hypothetical protein